GARARARAGVGGRRVAGAAGCGAPRAHHHDRDGRGLRRPRRGGHRQPETVLVEAELAAGDPQDALGELHRRLWAGRGRSGRIDPLDDRFGRRALEASGPRVADPLGPRDVSVGEADDLAGGGLPAGGPPFVLGARRHVPTVTVTRWWAVGVLA